MYRLNQRALQILLTEVQKCSGDDQVSKIEQEIVIKRLNKLRSQKGSPAQLDELHDTVMDKLTEYPQEDIVLAFHEPKMRQYTDFAVAA